MLEQFHRMLRLLDLERALDAAECPATRLCTLCGCAQEVTPLLRGFGRIADSVRP